MYTVKMVQSKEELELAFSIRRKVFVEEQGVPIHLELDEYDKNAVHFIVYDEDQAIAAARLREIESKIGKVERVCVLKPYRGKKLGVLIMKNGAGHLDWSFGQLDSATGSTSMVPSTSEAPTSAGFEWSQQLRRARTGESVRLRTSTGLFPSIRLMPGLAIT